MNRTGALVLILAGCLTTSLCGSAQSPRVLFSNDATNLHNAPAPGMERASVPERLDTTVAEAAGADLHLMQPGNGWVPWWRSAQYPADAHYRWFTEISGREPDAMGQFMRDGGDLVEEFIRACRAQGISAGVSLRLNDYHGSESWDVLRAFLRGEMREASVPVGLGAMAAQSRVLLERPENQLKPDPLAYTALPWKEKLDYASNPTTRITLRTARVWNWAQPDAPAYKLGFIRELCGYDLDALELDFMRWASFFRTDETPLEERRAIMLAFIKKTRAALDRGAPPGHRRSLGVRVPSRLSGHDPLGIDLRSWVAAGVDWVNLSCHYISEQQTELAAICRLIPDTPVYLELTFANTGRRGERKASLDGTEEAGGYGLMTPEQFYTAAHLAYSRGAAGVSLFNFVYYRNLGETPQVPPFAVLARLKDRLWLARQPQHYFLSMSGNPPSGPSQFTRNRNLSPGTRSHFELDMAPPSSGWVRTGRLRLELSTPWEDRFAVVRMNGQPLLPDSDVSEPYPTSYANLDRNRGAHLRAWSVPPGLLKDGRNLIDVILTEGPPAEIHFLDLAVH